MHLTDRVSANHYFFNRRTSEYSSHSHWLVYIGLYWKVHWAQYADQNLIKMIETRLIWQTFL